ncbi:contact-dependent growth inhibition system immunity protein [Nocardia takedensis]|uniref:contact-dependent growth inhibition system immunity protein n=1 Tax=Nocardia takedensis TaxID=259390 RepID=UPI003F760FCF
MSSEDSDDRSLEQIEGTVWPDPAQDSTYLVRTVHQLRRKPIGVMTAEDLRILLGQREGVGILLPRALTIIEQDPLAQGDFYPGDLLSAVVRAPKGYWLENPVDATRLGEVIERLGRIVDIDRHLPATNEVWNNIAQLYNDGVIDSNGRPE